MVSDFYRVPTRNGLGVTVGSLETIMRNKRYVREILDSLVKVRCNCREVEVTLPLKEEEKCSLCHGLFQTVSD